MADNASAAITITGTAGVVVALDPAELQVLGGNSGIPTRVIIDKISFVIEAATAVNLYWEATTNQLIASLTSGDKVCNKEFGGLYNNEATGVTGKLVYSTSGWSAGAVLSYTVLLECRKK